MTKTKQLDSLLQDSFFLANQCNHEFCTPEHLLQVSIRQYSVARILEKAGANIEKINTGLNTFFQNQVPIVKEGQAMSSTQFNKLLDDAEANAAGSGKPFFGIDDILVQMFDLKDSWCAYILQESGASKLRLMETITEIRREMTKEKGFSLLEDDTDSDLPDFFFDDDDDDDEFSAGSVPALEKYATNLTQKARRGELDPLIGREEELDRTMQVLCRRKKNNPLHVGDPGVGKTAITEGLAQKILDGDVPELLKDCEIFSIDMGSLVAGTEYRGEFEKRLKQIIYELLAKKKAILFIDEIHTLVGAGAVSTGNLDAANILKPILTSGKVRCIGSTTFEEYTKYFEKDRALSRRFQKIDILEPGKEDTLKILQKLQKHYEDFHKAHYTDDALTTAIDLSVQYLPERKLPDKAIDIIDEAGAWCRLHCEKKDETVTIDVPVIRKITSRMAGIPLEEVTQSEVEKLKELEGTIQKKIFGQDEAVKAVCLAVKKSRAGFRNPDKPEAAFLFVGPTGVGKTELTKILAQTLGEKLLRYDMSEYQEAYTVSRLIGSAPGYVGYENGGVLTEEVRKAHHAVILFDEIEKAHPSIFNLLLQVMDYGTLTDSQGRKADFRNSIIIMTSNAGASELSAGKIGFSGKTENSNEASATLKEAVKRTFTPEFRNRLDAVITFENLPRNIVLDIAKKEVSLVKERLLAKKVILEAEDAVIEKIADWGYSPEFGARNISRTVEEKISLPLVDEVLFGKLSSGGKVKALRKGDEIEFVY